jgi:hypothetical protein
VIREKRATFSCQPNLATRPPTRLADRLFLAGDHSWAEYPATLEGAVRSGLRAARLALRRYLIRPSPGQQPSNFGDCDAHHGFAHGQGIY